MLFKVPFLAVLCTFIAVTIAAPLPQDPANLDPANLDPAVDPANLDPANLDPGIANVDPANLDPANLDPANLDPGVANVDPANLDPANLDPANLDPANLDPANLDPANLDPANLDPANLDPQINNVPTPVFTPVEVPKEVPVHKPVKNISFDKWGGHESLKGFDDFYGVDNWDGYKFNQVFVKQEKELVCRVQEVQIVQQRLLVLQEMVKKVITETICEVETQTIVFEQFRGGLHGFGRDLVRWPGHHQIGYDQEIVKHFPKIINQHDFSVNTDDWKFSGKDLGKHSVIVKGHNWDDKRSPKIVHKAWNAARNAWFNLYGGRFGF